MTRRRLATVAAALAVGLAVTASAAPARAQSTQYGPHVVVWLQAAGGDAVDVHLPYSVDVHEPDLFARAAAYAVGARTTSRPTYVAGEYEYEVLTVQLRGRLAQREGADLRYDLDLAQLSGALAQHGYHEDYAFSTCAPDIGVTLSGTPPQPRGPLIDSPGFDCFTWVVAPGDPVSIGMHVEATSDGFVRLGVTLIAGATLGAAIAMGAAFLLRRKAVATAGIGSFVGVGIGVLLAVLAPVVAGLALVIENSPVASHAVASNLSQSGHVIATGVLALVLALPGTAFAFAMARTPAAPWQPAAPPVAYGAPMPPPPPPQPWPPAPTLPSGGDPPGLPSWLDDR